MRPNCEFLHNTQSAPAKDFVEHEAHSQSHCVRVRHRRVRAGARLSRSRFCEPGDSSSCRHRGRSRAHLEALVLAAAEIPWPGQEAKTGGRRFGTRARPSRGCGQPARPQVGRAAPSEILQATSLWLRGGSSGELRLEPQIVFAPLFARTSSESAPVRASSRLGRSPRRRSWGPAFPQPMSMLGLCG